MMGGCLRLVLVRIINMEKLKITKKKIKKIGIWWLKSLFYVLAMGLIVKIQEEISYSALMLKSSIFFYVFSK